MSAPGFVHEALLYDSEQVFLDTTVPFLQDGMAAGDGIVVATTDANAHALRNEFKGDADRIVFADPNHVYRSPAAAIAAYDEVLKSMAAAGFPTVRAIGEVVHGTERQSRWLPYEPAAHGVFTGRDLWVICPYDTRSVPSAFVEHARRAHPLVRDPLRHDNDDFVEPETLLRTVQPEPIPAPAGPPALQITAQRRLGHLRRTLIEALAGSGVDAEQTITAVNEIATNAVRHGGGTAYVSLWIGADRVICDVFDPGGRLDDPYAGYRPPSDHASGGMGLWLARQMSDEMNVIPGARGLLIRLGFASTPAA